MGEEITFSQRTRVFLDSLTDEEFEYLFRLLKYDSSSLQLIDSFADIDYQSKVALRGLPRLIGLLAKRPRLLRKVTQHYSIHSLL